MHQAARFGANRTGALAAKQLGREMIEGIERFLPERGEVSPSISESAIAQAGEESPVGHVPLPELPFEADEQKMALFMDKLGERLAFERTGVRLYEGVLTKLEAYGSYPGGPEEEDLERIREEELVHFQTLADVIREYGGDPTAVTPSADVAAQIGAGIGAVVADPRTTLVQSLEAMMVAELADTECWEVLVDLARTVGRDDVAERLWPFVAHEEAHREQLRRWIALAQLRDVPAH